jgi:prepilin-type N-terminal cleavage/methylation domain-containing protein
MKATEREAFLGRPGTTERTTASRDRQGLTLIELMVVVAVLLLLVAVAVPRMKPALESGRLREGARQMNSYFALARARATQIGRPAGVWLERSNPGENSVFELFLAEIPEPYTGDFIGATATVIEPDPVNFPNIFQVAFTSANVLTDTEVLVNADDYFLIQFDFRGHRFRCRRDDKGQPNTPINHIFVIDGRPRYQGGDALTPSITGRAVGFQIYRSPRKAMGRPLQLGGDVIVDLEFSGMGLDFSAIYPRIGQASVYPATTVRAPGLEFAALNPNLNNLDTRPIVIMFDPGGSVHSVSAGGVPFVRPTGTIHLLMGRTEGLERSEALAWSTAEPNKFVNYSQNLVDGSNLWISIAHRTGAITTSPNAWEVPDPNIGVTYMVDSLRFAREFAQKGQGSGGQ